MDRRSGLAEGLAAAGLSAFFFWGLRFFPLIGIAFVPAAALPLVRLGTRLGPRVATLSAVCAAAFSAAIGFALTRSLPDAGGQAIAFLATAGACGIAGGLARSRRASAVFLGLCVYGAAAGAAVWSFGPGATPAIERDFDRMAAQGIASVRQSGADAAMLARTQATIDLTRRIIVNGAPGLIAALWVLLAAVAFFLGRRLAPDRGDRSDFSRFHLPPACAAIFVLSGAAVAVLRGPARWAAADVLAPLLVLYFLVGLSIITYFARRWLRTGVLRAAVYVTASWFPFPAGTAALGLFDWYFDFRKKAEQRAIGRSE